MFNVLSCVVCLLLCFCSVCCASALLFGCVRLIVLLYRVLCSVCFCVPQRAVQRRVCGCCDVLSVCVF